MAEGPRRRRLQIHLSTAIVLMFAAGGFIWANVVPKVVLRASLRASFAVTIDKYGWPCVVMVSLHGPYSIEERRVWERLQDIYSINRCWGIGINLAFAILALFAVGCGCELLIRRNGGKESK